MIKLIIDRNNGEMHISAKGRTVELMAEYTMLTMEFLSSFSGEGKEMMKDYFKNHFADLVTLDSDELKGILFKTMMDRTDMFKTMMDSMFSPEDKS